MTQNEVNADVAKRNRMALVILVVVFFGGLIFAGALRFSGWQPQGMKNKGELLSPYVDLRTHALTQQDAAAYTWEDSPRTWRILAMPQACDGARHAACQQLLMDLDKVWRLMGKEADRVHVLWGGAKLETMANLREVYPIQVDATLGALLPQVSEEGDAVWLIDPNGFVVLRYAPGFDPADLRTDLARLLRIN